MARKDSGRKPVRYVLDALRQRTLHRTPTHPESPRWRRATRPRSPRAATTAAHLGAGIAQVIQVFVVDGKGDRFPAIASGDLKDEDGVVILTGPGRNLRWVATIGFENVSREIAEDDVFPGDKDGRTVVTRFPQFAFETINLAKAELGIDRQAAANGGGLDGCQGADIKISNTIFLLIDPVGGIRRKNKLGGTIFCKQYRGQGQGAIEAAAGQLSKPSAWFFPVADADNCFHGLCGSFRWKDRIGLSINANANRKSN